MIILLAQHGHETPVLRKALTANILEVISLFGLSKTSGDFFGSLLCFMSSLTKLKLFHMINIPSQGKQKWQSDLSMNELHRLGISCSLRSMIGWTPTGRRKPVR